MTFDEWLNEQEGFGLRSERLYEDINNSIRCDEEGFHCNFVMLRIWLHAAYEAGKEYGIEAAKWW